MLIGLCGVASVLGREVLERADDLRVGAAVDDDGVGDMGCGLVVVVVVLVFAERFADRGEAHLVFVAGARRLRRREPERVGPGVVLDLRSVFVRARRLVVGRTVLVPRMEIERFVAERLVREPVRERFGSVVGDIRDERRDVDLVDRAPRFVVAGPRGRIVDRPALVVVASRVAGQRPPVILVGRPALVVVAARIAGPIPVIRVGRPA